MTSNRRRLARPRQRQVLGDGQHHVDAAPFLVRQAVGLPGVRPGVRKRARIEAEEELTRKARCAPPN